MAASSHDHQSADLRELVQGAVDELVRAAGTATAPRVELERPRDERHGDIATNAALLLAPVLRQPPRAVAEELATRLRDLPGVTSVDVAGPGFINFTMSDAWFLGLVRRALEGGSDYASGVVADAEPVLLEFVSANPTGPMVAASARHAAYGDSLARLLRHAGHPVATEYYVNDAGRQVDLFGQSILARATGGEVPEGGYEGGYVAELARALGAGADDDPVELGTRGVAAMVEGVRGSLARVGVEFDRFQSERELHDSGAVTAGVEALRAAGATFVDDDGATLLRTTEYGDDKDRHLVRANGVPTYFAADVAYLADKFARVGEGGRLIYVLGADHHGYVARLQAAARALGHAADECEVVIMQMVSLLEGGEQRTMSKRRGDFVTSDELVARIGSDATRFFMLNRSHDQGLDLDLELAAQQSDANPVFYVQYAHARLCSVLRRAQESGFSEADAEQLADDALDAPLHASEKRLARRIGELPTAIVEAAARRQPHRLVHYAHDLASDVAKFYRDCRVTGDGVDTTLTRRRMATGAAARGVLALVLGLVGVSAPERMEQREVAVES